MTIRSIILVLAVPLFLLLATVNGALLYFQQRAELEQAFNDQAVAAAVTIAEFVREMDDPATTLQDPLRRRALTTALGRVDDLDGAYLLRQGKEPLALKAATSGWDVTTLKAPEGRGKAVSDQDGASHRWVTAQVPAGNGRNVAVRLDAEPVFAQLERTLRHVIAIVVMAGLFAAALGVIVARRIAGELRVSRDVMLAPQDDADTTREERLRIREAQNLTEAVRLMEASSEAADRRARLEIERAYRDCNLAGVVSQTQTSLFAPASLRHGPIEAEMRLCGDVPAGSFFAHAVTGRGGGSIVLGRCLESSPVEELAGAAAIRAMIEKCQTAEQLQKAISLIGRTYSLERMEVHDADPGIGSGEEVHLYCMADSRTQAVARAYHRANPGLSPAELIDGLDALVSPDGIFAAWGLARSVERGQGRGGIRLYRENAAETADIEHFAH